jgi:hypothetical protein
MKYKNAIKSGKFKSGLTFWHQVQRDALSHGAFDVYQKNRHYYGREEGEEVTVIPTGLDGVTPVQPKEYMFDLIHRNAFDEKRGPFQKIVKPMQISRAKLVELADAYSAPKGELKAPFYPALGAAFGSGPMEGASRRASIANSYVDISALVLPVTIAQTIAKQSEILTEHSACQLLAMCFPFVTGSDPSPTPAPVPVDHGLYLLFSSGQHGFSLSSLYSRTQGISPLVVLIKSVRGETQVRIHLDKIGWCWVRLGLIEFLIGLYWIG